MNKTDRKGLQRTFRNMDARLIKQKEEEQHYEAMYRRQHRRQNPMRITNDCVYY